MRFVKTDGGRVAAGFTGSAGDCVTRSIAIAAGLPYAGVYRALAAGNGAQRAGKRGKRAATAREGVNVTRKWFKDYMRGLGFRWVPTMTIGSGCTVHLHDGELPSGRLVVSVSKHYTAVIDGVVHDTHDPQREIAYLKPGPGGLAIVDRISRRCVYGYWIFEGA